MPTKFQDNWLKKDDSNGTKIKDWARKIPSEPYSCECFICNRKIKVNKGFPKLTQHSSTAVHKKNFAQAKSQTTIRVEVLQKNTEESTPSMVHATEPSEHDSSQKVHTAKKVIQTTKPSADAAKKVTHAMSLHNPREDAIKAELLWCLEIIASKSSVASCSGKRELFNVMFPEGVPATFSLSASKASYLITDALGPYFKNELLKEIQDKNKKVTIQFDETSNVKTKKELQIRIIYWSDLLGLIVNRHLETRFIERGNAATIFENLENSLDSNRLLQKQILTLARDGPNVNKTVFNKFQEKNKLLNIQPLVDIGSCTIHTIHNAFLKGLESLSIDISDFIIKVYYFFHHKDLRWSNYQKVQQNLNLPAHSFEKHISTRWLTMGPAADRILEQWTGLEEYFLKFIPSQDPKTSEKESYKDVIKYLKNPFLKCFLAFVSYMANIFTTQFTLLMQKEEPLIHILYSKVRALVMFLMSNIIKEKSEKFKLEYKIFDENKIEKVLDDFSKTKPVLEIICGDQTKQFLKIVDKNDTPKLMTEIQKFYKNSILYIDKKITRRNILKYFECLSPENIKNVESARYICKISEILPLDDINSDVLHCEWKMLQVNDCVTFSREKNERIDHYWNKIFSLESPGSKEARYPTIAIVVKAALTLPQGNAAVERGFSESGLQLTEDKAHMTERTLNAKLTIADAIKRYNKEVYKIPITKELIKKGQNAYRTYNDYLEEQHRLREEQEKQKIISEQEKVEQKELLERLDQGMRTIRSLEDELKNVKKMWMEADANAVSMQNLLNESIKKSLSPEVIKKLMASWKILSTKAKNEREKMDKLQEAVRKQNAVILKVTVNNKKQSFGN